MELKADKSQKDNNKIDLIPINFQFALIFRRTENYNQYKTIELNTRLSKSGKS